MPGLLCMFSPLIVIEIAPGFDSKRRITWGPCSGQRFFTSNRFEGMCRHLGSCRIKTEPIRSIPSKSSDGKTDKNYRVDLPSHVNYISSVANPYVKHLVKLRQSTSYRHSVGSVVVVGSTPLRCYWHTCGLDRDFQAHCACKSFGDAEASRSRVYRAH